MMSFDMSEYGGYEMLPVDTSSAVPPSAPPMPPMEHKFSDHSADDAKEQKRLADNAIAERAALAAERDRLAREKQQADTELAAAKSSKNLLQSELELERNRRLYGVDKIVLDVFGRPIIPFRSNSSIGDYVTKERIKDEIKEELRREKRDRSRWETPKPRRSPARPRSPAKSKPRARSKSKSKPKSKVKPKSRK